MSERGSFVTEYIYCSECFRAAKSALLSRNRYMCSAVIQSWEPGGAELPIIAGKSGGLYPCEEIDIFEQIAEDLEKAICHPMRIAVLAEQGERIFNIMPSVKIG